jgi:hypothetical protein
MSFCNLSTDAIEKSSGCPLQRFVPHSHLIQLGQPNKKHRSPRSLAFPAQFDGTLRFVQRMPVVIVPSSERVTNYFKPERTGLSPVLVGGSSG